MFIQKSETLPEFLESTLQGTLIFVKSTSSQDARTEDENEALSALVWSKFDHLHRLLSELSSTAETSLPPQDSERKYCTSLAMSRPFGWNQIRSARTPANQLTSCL